MKKSYLFLISCFLLLNVNVGFSMSTVTSNEIATPANNVPDAPTIKSAFKELMSLSRLEKKERIRDAKAEIKKFKAAKRAGDNVSTNQLLLVILAILLPPLAVYLHEGTINNKFWIDLVLTLLFFIPGIIYALIVVLGH